jgi:hypothetical protein
MNNGLCGTNGQEPHKKFNKQSPITTNPIFPQNPQFYKKNPKAHGKKLEQKLGHTL